MYKIPTEFRDLPEAARLRNAQAKFAAAAEEGRHLTFENEEQVRSVGEKLRKAQNELQQAQKVFDLVTGEPKPVGLTPAVVDEVGKHFSAEQIGEVKELLEKECGRTLPFNREATAEQLEYIRICVLRLSNGDFSQLRNWVTLANIDQRDVLLAAAPLMKQQQKVMANGLDTTVKLALYRMIAQTGTVPTSGETAYATGLSEDDIRAAFASLHAKRLLVPEPGDPSRIRMAPPFSGVATSFPVEARGKRYYANCVWDAFGIAAALHADAIIPASDSFSGEPLILEVRNGQPTAQPYVAHFAVPAAHWWDDIIYT
jgi:alkylmercury lyase-like protein